MEVECISFPAYGYQVLGEEEASICEEITNQYDQYVAREE